MKNKLLSVIILINFVVFSQCPTGDLLFETQAELDQFIIDYPNCKEINGRLIVQSSLINNFSPLSNIEVINGTLIIQNIENIYDLSGFTNLTQVGGLDVSSSSFTSLNGLDNLETINGNLEIGYNFDLIDISSLSNLLVVDGNMYLRYLAIKNLISINNIDYSRVTNVELVGLSELESIGSENFCNYIKEGGSYGAIASNAVGFNSLEEIITNCNLTIPLDFFGEITETWSSNGSTWSSSVCNNVVTASVSGLQNGASVTFSQEILGCNIANTYSSNMVVNQPALGAFLDYNSTNGGVGVLTFTFSREVENPIIHIDKIGGFSGNASNAVLLTLLNPNLSLTKLSGNDVHFEVTANTITRTPGQTSGSAECGTATNGSAAGSVQVNGVLSEVSFQFELNGDDGIGDLFEVIWELVSCDFDLDGIIDRIDLDDDNDGILDTVELNGNPTLDTDNDGLIDSFDVDSDNDGCFDVIEAGFDDPDANGTLGDLPDTVDSNGLIINEPNGYTTPKDVNSNSIFDFQENNLPIIITQPNNSVSSCEQETLVIPIAVSNSSSIQWQVSIDLGTTWTDLNNDSIYSGVNTQNLQLSNVPLSFNGYWFRVKLDEFCSSLVFSDVTELSVLKIPNTGIDGEKVFCPSDAPEDLLSFLGGNPDNNGVWSPALNSGSGVFDPTLDIEGIYTYTINNGYCDVSTSTVTVGVSSVLTQPESNFTLCEQSNLTIPISVSDSFIVQWQFSSDFGASWMDLNNDLIYSGVETQNLQLSNIPLAYNGYWFRAKDEFCVSSNSTEVVELTVLKFPYTGVDAYKIFCPYDEPEDLLDLLGEDLDDNGIWNPRLNSGSGIFDPNIDAEGTYTYTIDNGYCFDESTVLVKFSSEVIDVTIDVVDNSRNNSITINASGIGDYEYSIDGVNYQDSNIFDNLYPDIYNIFVKDKNGCGIKEFEQAVLGYPKFFTPNNDGRNDVWNIKGGNNTEYTINIYDRYGKLLKTFDNSSLGWNGRFNNQDMPASDYWFHFITSEGRKIIGHFALKR